MQFRIAKEKLQELKQETAHIRLAKEELQELDRRQSNPNVVKEKTKNQDSRWMQGASKEGCNK